jgi:hypothetical protein
MTALSARTAAPRPAAARGKPVQPAQRPASASGQRTGLPRYLQANGGRGQPLPGAVRQDMEGRFGAPLADVRVHVDGAAADSAAALGARAYTAGSDIVFGAGPEGSRFAPHSAEGRGLLAHELTHVLQQRHAGTDVPQASVADGGARRDNAEREAEANAARVGGNAALTAKQWPATTVQRAGDGGPGVLDRAAGALGDVASAGVDALGSAANAGAEALGSLALGTVRRLAPQLLPLIERGPVAVLRELVSAALDGLASGLNALDPSGSLTAMLGVFTGLVQRAAGIAAALLSGDCQPLLDALDQMKSFVTEVAGEAWDRLTGFLQPVGDFFTDLWSGYGAPAIDWLKRKAGAVWARIEQFATDLWNWTAPVRGLVGDVWGWVKEQLFGPEDAASADSSGGIVGWVSAKAGEAWAWVKEQTAPVWQPIAETAQRVAEMLPPPWMRNFGQQMQQMSAHLNDSAAAMQGGEGVAENRDTLASVLPSVTQLIGTVRGVIVEAGGWVSTKVVGFGGAISSVMGQLRSSSILAMLANALGWLEDAALRLVGWANEQVASLFDWLLQGFDALRPFIEHAAGVVRRLIGVVGDLMSLPQLILSSVWGAIPCCIREPIKNFVFNQILARIPVFGQFFSDPTLWPRVQATALRILRQVFVDGDLAGAAWTFFQSVLRVLGLPPELVVQVLAKAAAAIGDILTDPVGFLINLLGAMKAGFGRFFGNIGTHLLNGISGWLFGQAESAGIAPPTDFSIGSIFGFVLQVLGITVEHVFERLARKLDPGTVARMRQILSVATGVWHFISILVNDGPAALWVEIQSQLSSLWTKVIDGVIGWVTEAIIGRATIWLMGLLDVSGITPVINTLIAVYNAIESFVQYLRQMLEIVSRVLDGVLDIAHGQIDGAAGFLEDALDRSLPVAIGFLANQFGLGRVGQRMHELMESVRGVIDAGIDWLIDQGIALGQAFIAMARSGAAAVRGAVTSALGWLGIRIGFNAADGSPHLMYFDGEGANAALTVESQKMTYAQFLTRVQPTADANDMALARRLFAQIQSQQQLSPPAPGAPGTAGANDPNVRIPELTNQLSIVTGRLMASLHGGVTRSEPPVYSGLRDGFGTRVTVRTLTNDAAGGSEPGTGVVGGLWDDLALRGPSGSNPYYVRGHLLNHNLGGTGDSWANLTPLTQAANNRGGGSMLRVFEAPLKAELRAGKEASNVVVQSSGSLPGRSADLQHIDAEIAGAAAVPPRPTVRPLDELRSIRRVVNAEQHVPATLSMSATVVDPRVAGATPTSLSLPALANVIDPDWTRYQLRR